jgi:hypothetical protein
MLAVSWTAVSGATSYDVYVSTTTTQGSVTANVPVPFYDITGLTNNSSGTRYVWVKAKNADGASGFSAQATGTPAAVTVPANLQGNHQADRASVYMWDYTDGFEITGTSFTHYSDTSGTISLAGTIVKIIPQDANSGRLLIKVTNGGGWGTYTVGAYTAVAYKAMTADLVDEAAPYKTGGTLNVGTTTLAQAIGEYAYSTAADGYYGYFGSYQPHAATYQTLAPFQGTWGYDDDGAGNNTLDYYIIINGTSYIEFTDQDNDGAFDETNDALGLVLKGDIVDSTDTTADTGILYIKTFDGDGTFTNLKFIAVEWDSDGNNAAGGPGIDFATQESSGIEEGTLAGAKSTWATPSFAGFVPYALQP